MLETTSSTMDENLRNFRTELCQETYLQREFEITLELIHSQNIRKILKILASCSLNEEDVQLSTVNKGCSSVENGEGPKLAFGVVSPKPDRPQF